MRFPLLAVLAILPLPHALGAQAIVARTGWRVGAGVSSPATWLEQGDGLAVRTGLAPSASVERVWRRTPVLAYQLGVRVGTAGTTYDDETEWSGARLVLLELMGGSTRQFSGGWALHSNAGGVLLAGGGDGSPWGDASRFAPGVDVAIARRLSARRPVLLSLGGQFLRYGGGGGDAPTGAQSGTVMRVRLEVRHER